MLSGLSCVSRAVGIRAFATRRSPVRVAVTGAGGQIGYSLIPRIAAGDMFGRDQPVILHLLELPSPAAQNRMKGLILELQDCAFPLLSSVASFSDPLLAFRDVDFALLVGAKPRTAGMERADLLLDNAKIFQLQGKALNASAKRSVKVCVVGNPANTNAMICAANAPDISPSQITALMRLDQDRSVAQVAERLNVSIRDVDRLVVWGNHSPTMFPDLFTAKCGGKPLPSAFSGGALMSWMTKTFLPKVQQRGAEIIKARGSSSATSAANATICHMRDWVFGTAGRWVSMAVETDGSYALPKGLWAGVPCLVGRDGRVERVVGLKWSAEAEAAIRKSVAELEAERKAVKEFM